MSNTRFIMNWKLSWLPLTLFNILACLGYLPAVIAQSTTVSSTQSGAKVYLEIDVQQLQSELDTLFSWAAAAQSLDWNGVLLNGSNPGMDVNFGGYRVTGIGDLVASGVLMADSLALSKDAVISGRLNVTGVATIGDSLIVQGHVQVSEMLRVDSLVVQDVIQGQVSSLGNLTSDALVEGDSNLYLTSVERSLLASLPSLMATLDSLKAVVNGLGEVTDPAIEFVSCGDSLFYQGINYATVEIGSQCWFAENLRNDRYRNGDEIPSAIDNSSWSNATGGVQIAFENNPSNLEVYGRLYNSSAVVDARGLCPAGWHVPTDEEWTILVTEVGGSSTAGNEMKATPPAWDGSNSSGFNALPGGSRDFTGSFGDDLGTMGWWWSSTLDANGWWKMRNIIGGIDLVFQMDSFPNDGRSVRCLQDEL